MPASKAPVQAPRATVPARQLTLAETQALFQKAVLEGDESVLALLCDTSRTTRATLFGVYQNAYSGRLVEILANDYEYLSAYLGEDAFDDLARAYITECPSRSQNARWFGSRFPAFLANDKRYAKRPELADLAAVEKALADAFDAPDATVVTIADLAAFAPETWGQLVFAPHPSAILLTANSDAFALWMALKDERPPPKKKPSKAVRKYIAVWRNDATPVVREMGDEEAMMWTEACRGLRFDALCEMVATYDQPDQAALRAASYLQGWLSSGMLSSASLIGAQQT
ncbi:MAG: DNA-binding domain-containing protein [Hyphomicrobium sp.]